MAGDWIKFEKTTLDKPEVFEMAGKLGIDPDAVVGKLLRVWNWFDDQSVDGNAPVTVRTLLDRYSGVTGFVEAMEFVGWITVKDGQLKMTNFDRHNGSPAKSRASGKKRVEKHRKRNGECNGASVTNPLPEKRREEKSITPIAPKGAVEGMPKGWRSWKATRKQATRVNRMTPIMESVGALLGRKPTTLWSVAEVGALIDLNPTSEEVEALRPFYNAEIPPDKDHRRTSIATLLNNWNTEQDKARAWKGVAA